MPLTSNQRSYIDGHRPMLLTTRQVAQELAISAISVRRLADRGELVRIRIGGSVRFRARDVAHLVARGSSEQKSEEPASRPALRDHADAGGGHESA